MTNNGVGKRENFGNIVYDSMRDATNGGKRIGISATEIELLNDIPTSFGTGTTRFGNSVTDRTHGFDTQISSSSINKQQQQQQNSYQTLSINREQPRSNIVRQDRHDQQLDSAIDKLLDKYAPDATPYNLLNTSTSRQAPPPVNFETVPDQSSFSTFQTAPPSSSTATHNYSTIIRPNNGQIPQTQTNNNNNYNYNNQPSSRSRPVTSYDSFQHLIPPPPQQQQQQQQQPQRSIPITNKTGNVTQVVPGKLYALDDDPLYLFYDRQNPVPPNSKPSTRQQPTFKPIFQPSNNFQTTQDPLTTIFTNTSQVYPQQPIPMTMDANSNGIQAFDLGNFIKRVQQEYRREIEPFVSSVKFVEKDHEYGQSLVDVGFVTPVTVRKGYTRQADDILRRSFGRQDNQKKPAHHYEHNKFSDDDDDDIDELHPLHRRQPLHKRDSKQSFTSVSSISTNPSDYDDPYASVNKRKNKVNVRDQATSPPAKSDQTKTQSQMQNPSAASTVVPPKPIRAKETDEENTTSASPRAPPKLAKRISSDQGSITSSGSTISDDEEDDSAKYNEHEHPGSSRPNASIAALAQNTPVIKTTEETTRDRSNIGNQALQRSEDIHPTPPTIRASQPNPMSSTNARTQPMKSETEASDTVASGSDIDSGSDDDNKSVPQNNQIRAPITTRSNVPQITPSATPVRAPNTPQRTSIATPGRAPNTPQMNTQATTSPQNPSSTARTNVDNNARQMPGSGTNVNLHFAPPDQRRTATSDRTGPATSGIQPAPVGGAAGTGSTRFFKSDADAKNSGKRSLKDAPSAFRNRIKSLFGGKK